MTPFSIMEELVIRQLRVILKSLNQFGTPQEKLPNCPCCEQDELGVIHPGWVFCYKCNWSYEPWTENLGK